MNDSLDLGARYIQDLSIFNPNEKCQMHMLVTNNQNNDYKTTTNT